MAPMRYADPLVCPACRQPHEGCPNCPHCGLELSGHTARQIWFSLEQVDALLAATPVRPVAAEPVSVPSAPSPVGQFEPASTAPPVWAPAQWTHADPSSPSPVGHPTSAPPSVSAGTVLLGLGALSLLVAAVIFITVSWSALGVGGRAMVLLGATAVAAGLAVWADARRLRASAETLWLLAFGLFVLDWYAAWAQRHALGLGRLHVGPWSALFVLLIVGLAALVVRRSRVGVVAPDAVAAIVLWTSGWRWGVDLWDRLQWRPEWALLAMGALTGFVCLVAARLRLRLTRDSAVAALAVAAAGFLVAAVSRTVAHPSPSALVEHGAGLPTVIGAALAAAAGHVQVKWRSMWSALSIALIGWLIAVPGLFHGDGRWGVAALCVLLLVLTLAGLGPGGWLAGAQIVAIVVMMVLFAELLALASVLSPAYAGADTPRVPWPFALLVTVSLVAAVLAAAHWRRITIDALASYVIAFLIAELGILTVLTMVSAPTWVLAVATLLTASAGLATLGRTDGPVAWTGLALAAPALWYATDTEPLAIGVSAALAVMLAVAAWWVRQLPLRGAVSAGSTAAACACTTLVAHRLDGGLRGETLAATLTAIAAVAVASVVVRHVDVVRVAVEVTAALVPVTAVLLVVAGYDWSWTALLLALTGSALVAVGAGLPDRRMLLYPAGVCFAGAWASALAAADVQTVEAYSGPVAAVLLGIGGLWMLHDDTVRSWPALGAGVVLSLGPSLPQALADPTSVRAMLLGLVALMALGLGVWQSWQAPFVAGVVVAATLVAVNMWPLAMALQRWVLFAGVGAALLAVGVTWEQRVAQGRVVARYVARMR